MNHKIANAAALSYLKGRGIGEQTARVYRIEDSDNKRGAISYPTVGLAGSTAYRIKFTDGQKPKVLWDTTLSKQPDNLYYSAGGLKDAIERSYGELYWLSGEPDVWTFHTALYAMSSLPANATCVFGEGIIPDTLVTDLTALGVKTLMVLPDQDDTGLKSAAKLRRLLRGSGIVTVFYALPDGLDLNALWQHYKFDGNKFETIFDLAPEMDAALLDMYDTDDASAHIAPPLQSADLPPRFYAALDTAFGNRGVKRYKHNGFSNNIRCIFTDHEHDHETPAAAWNHDSHFFQCQKCGTTWNAIDTGERLGIDWHDFKERPAAAPTGSAPDRPRTQPPSVVPNAVNGDSEPVDLVEQRRESIVHHATKMASRYMGLVTGVSSGQGEPVVFPYNCFHEYGGLCRIIPAGMAVGVLAASGEGKTSFTENGIDALNRRGIDVGVWGPEWTPDYFMARRVQRYGGPTFAEIIDYQLWQKEAELNVHPDYRQGRELSKSVKDNAVQIAMDIEDWPGEAMCFYDDDPDGDFLYLEELLDHMGTTLRIERKNGRRLNMIVFDYAQLAELRQRVENGNAIEHVIGKIKNHAMKHQYVAWITTQAVKASSKLVRKASSDVLTGDDALYVRDDKFNLFLTLKRHYDIDLSLPEGEQQVPSEFVKVYIAKNSVAASRQIVPMQVDWARMRWLDRKLETRHIDLEEHNRELSTKGSTW